MYISQIKELKEIMDTMSEEDQSKRMLELADSIEQNELRLAN